MNQMEQLELLRAVLAVAAADGDIRRSELGVAKGLAERIGVGRTSFDAMLGEAEAGADLTDNIVMHSPESARTALTLLVAQARIDGEISSEERELIVRIACSLGVTDDDFQKVYQAGIERADTLRKARGL